MAAAAGALPIEQVLEEVINDVRPYKEAGFNHLVFHPSGHDQVGFLQSFATQVVPGLRGTV
ncbi:hypothetical protein ABZ863_26855 [Saccharomonospora sp. NPDC046836]|uniref:hypothetical protein n=1 Tax=Saccharomonospora sp. NPDC046836 TaxID=3156921 RepID=UPI0033EB99BB